MITKEIIKAEIDHIRDEYLEILYKIIKALELPADKVSNQADTVTSTKINQESEWHNFIKETYGCLADSPIECGDQGIYEVREAIE